MYEADSHTEGYLEQVYSKHEALPAMSMSSDDDTNFTDESDCELVWEHDSDVGLWLEGDVDAPYSVDSDGDVAMELDGDDVEAKKEEEEDEEVDHDKDEEDDDGEAEDEDEDDCEEPRTIGQGAMINTSTVHVESIEDPLPIMQPEQGQEMREHTPQPPPPAPAPGP